MRYRTINSGKRGFTVTGSLGANQTWQADTVPYIISSLTVPVGKTLTINPNVVAKFESIWATLAVNGTLNASGSSISRIIFTSISDDTAIGDTNADGFATSPALGDWRKIEIGSGATTTLDYTTVRYGGYYDGYNVYNNGGTLDILNSSIASSSSYGIYHTSGTTEVATSTFNGNGSYGIYGAGSGVLSISNSNFYNNSTSAGYFDLGSGVIVTNSDNTASGTGKRGFTVTGSLGANQTWQADGVPYIISSITIPSGKTLTINPNAVVKFESIWATLAVNGTLTASGNSLYPVYFTSLKDDTIGGETNSDNSATSPASGDWRKIEIGSGGTANLSYSIIRYGGYYDGYELYNNSGTLTIATSTIAYGSSYGV